MNYDEIMDAIRKRLESHHKALMDMGYTEAWNPLRLDKGNEPEVVLKNLDKLLSADLFINYVLEACPDSIVVTDMDGMVIRMNPAFQHTTGVNRTEALGDTVYEHERKGFFKPSVNGIALKEKRQVTIIQMGKNQKETVVTSAPIRDSENHMLGAVSNAKRLDEIDKLVQYSYRNRNSKSTLSDDNQQNSPVKMISQSPIMCEIKSMIDHIIDTDSNILISGKTGVGKGVMANYIHQSSQRSKYKLVEINCGAIPESLLESELFGYESGAFTGARSGGKKGLIELADKGTILFDEINDLPLLLQVKLLHYIQKKTIVRVGGTEEIKVDARIIAASNKNLEELVEKGLFREDLYYRLNVIPVKIPPLRERPEDIEAGAQYFLNIYNQKYGKNVILREEALKDLRHYSWPGNMRELENFIERLVVSQKDESNDKNIQLPRNNKPLSKQDSYYEEGKTLKEALSELERDIIVESFAKNKSSYKVAESLAISQTSAYRKIKQYVEETTEKE